jgi:hypothetical protein
MPQKPPSLLGGKLLPRSLPCIIIGGGNPLPFKKYRTDKNHWQIKGFWCTVNDARFNSRRFVLKMKKLTYYKSKNKDSEIEAILT